MPEHPNYEVRWSPSDGKYVAKVVGGFGFSFQGASAFESLRGLEGVMTGGKYAEFYNSQPEESPPVSPSEQEGSSPESFPPLAGNVGDSAPPDGSNDDGGESVGLGGLL